MRYRRIALGAILIALAALITQAGRKRMVRCILGWLRPGRVRSAGSPDAFD
jgi:hypothetical protein